MGLIIRGNVYTRRDQVSEKSNRQTSLIHFRYRDDLISLVKKLLDLEPKNRNVGRAYLTYNAKSKSNLLPACLKYFDSHCTRRACFGDLKIFLPQLSHDDQSKFLNHIDKAAKSYYASKDEDTADESDAIKVRNRVFCSVKLTLYRKQHQNGSLLISTL
jgi:hypothetical protein